MVGRESTTGVSMSMTICGDFSERKEHIQSSKLVWPYLLAIVLSGAVATLVFKYEEHQLCQGFAIGVSAIGGCDGIGGSSVPPIYFLRGNAN
jgi:hypothetical protein